MSEEGEGKVAGEGEAPAPLTVTAKVVMQIAQLPNGTFALRHDMKPAVALNVLLQLTEQLRVQVIMQQLAANAKRVQPAQQIPKGLMKR